MLHKYKGCLLGLAIGDAIGTTVEFMDRGTFPPVTDMVGGGPFKLKAGQWTDDTSMALCLGQSLIDCQGFDAHDQIQKYIRWYDDGYMSVKGECFDIGSTTQEALWTYMTDSRSPYAGSTYANASGNGSLMRFAPISMWLGTKPDVNDYAALSSKVTHGSQDCIETCRIMNYILQLFWQIRPNETAKKMIISEMDEVLQDELANSIPRFQSMDFLDKPIEKIHGTGYAVDALEAALWCFFNTDTFEDAVLTAVNLGDDADTTGAIVGQIAGAYYGVECIPEKWINKLYWKDIIEEMSVKLFDLSQGKEQ